MPTQTGSIDFTSAGGLKSYAAGQFATQGTVTDMQTQISQNANDITLRATKTEAYQVAQPNLSPYYSSVPYASTNTYWKSIQLGNGFTFTSMGDGWMRVQCTNSGSSVIRRDWYPIKCSSVRAGQPYTWLAEVRNNASSSVSSNSDFYLVQTNNLQFWGQKAIKTIEGPSGSGMSVNIGTCGSTYTLRKVQNAETADGGHWTNNDEANVVGLACWTFRCAANSTIDYEVRLSVYEGEYTGPYKPYSGTQLYASQAELKVQADRIGMVVSNADASSSLQLTPAAITAVTNNLTIKDSSGSATVISGGKIQANSIGADEINATSINASKSLTVGAMTDAAASTILNSNVQVGGRNLLLGAATQDTSVGNSRESVNETNDTWLGCKVFRSSAAWADIGFRFDIQVVNRGLAKVGDVLTYSIWAKTDDTTSRDIYGIWINNKAGGNHMQGAKIATLTSEWTRYEKQITVTQAMLNAATVGMATRFECNTNCTSGKYIYWAAPKLEKGNKATDWTPAPEDMESSIIEASKTASNYITADSTGIKIHMSGSTSTYQHQSSTATTYYVNGNKRAEVGAGGLKVYVGNTGSEVSVAEFGTTARLGAESGYHTEVTSTGMHVSDGTDDVVRIHSEVTQDGIRYGSIDIGKSGDGTLTSVGGSADDYAEGDDYVLHRRTANLTAMASTESDGAWVEAWAERASTWDEDSTGITLHGEQLNLWGQNGEGYGSVSMENAGKVISTQSGMVSQSISAAANAVTTYTVTFPNPYDVAPIVVACFYSTSTAAAFGGLSLSVSAITTTSFTVKIFNNTGTGRSPGLFWIATPQTSQT